MESHKGFSCLECRQRKVKCNRGSPCSNCIKTSKECSFVAPVRGKRKRMKPPKEGLHAKLRRYEEMLQTYGVEIDRVESDRDATSAAAGAPTVDDEPVADDGPVVENEPVIDKEPMVRRENTDPFRLEESKPKLITKEGTSRYLDSALWANLGDQFQHPEIGAIETTNEANQESGMFFEFNSCQDLSNLHPPVQILPELKTIWIDRVDPLLKILHIPTFWPLLLEVRQNPRLSKGLEALTFAFYLAVINTLDENECQRLFFASTSAVYSRYHVAARQALTNAGFMSTSDLMTLQGYTIFMVCMRKTYRNDTLFVMSGIAVRLARKMGLHRDGTSLRLSPFETEIRRRLWWYLVHVDFCISDAIGARPSLDLMSSDTKRPLNVHDEDLYPDAAESPVEHKGITATTLHLVKYQIMQTLHRFSSVSAGYVQWEVLSTPDVKVAKKDSMIDEIEDQLENKYMRYCDPSEPLHTFVSIMIRTSICKMRLMAHNPRQFANSTYKTPWSEREIVFRSATKLLEHVIFLHGASKSLKKYMWQIGPNFMWNAMLYVLIEIRHRDPNPVVDKAWRLIDEVMSYYPQISEPSCGALLSALGKWTLEVWDQYMAKMMVADVLEPAVPDCIITIRERHKLMESQTKRSRLSTAPENQVLSSDNLESVNSATLEWYDFPDLNSFETDPNEWVQWEQLMVEHSTSGPVGHTYS